jgi:MHS family alpha-ketoglutarate permease-like MFS transporter
MAEQFPTRVRVAGVALPYAISVTLLSGTAPDIRTSVTKAGNGHVIWVYVAIVSRISFLSTQ